MRDLTVKKLTKAQLIRLLKRWMRDRQDTRDIHRHNAKTWEEDGDKAHAILSKALAERQSAEIEVLSTVLSALQGHCNGVLIEAGATAGDAADSFVRHAERFAVCTSCKLSQTVTRSEASPDRFMGTACWRCGKPLTVGRIAKGIGHRGARAATW